MPTRRTLASPCSPPSADACTAAEVSPCPPGAASPELSDPVASLPALPAPRSACRLALAAGSRCLHLMLVCPWEERAQLPYGRDVAAVRTSLCLLCGLALASCLPSDEGSRRVMLLPASSCLHVLPPAGSSWPLLPGPRSVPNWLPLSPPRAPQCHRSMQWPELSEPRWVRSRRRSIPEPVSAATPAPGPSPVRGARLGAAGTLAPCLALHQAACGSPSAPRVVGPAEQPPGALVDT